MQHFIYPHVKFVVIETLKNNSYRSEKISIFFSKIYLKLKRQKQDLNIKKRTN